MRHLSILFLFLLGGYAYAGNTPTYVWTTCAPMRQKQVKQVYVDPGTMPVTAATATGAPRERVVTTIYTPFSATLPSAHAEAVATGGNGPTGPRKDFVHRPDDDPAQTSPVGEPWILILFATLFGGAVAWRRTRILGN